MSGVRPKLAGVFIAQLDDAYQIEVWRGIDTRARELGIGVVCFVGHRLSSPVTSESAANIAYRIADPRSIDGLIVISSAIAGFLSLEEMLDLFRSRPGIPQVSLGLSVPGVPSVRAPGAEGMSAVVRHLARDHQRRRFALVRGPAGHPEAAEREQAFRDTLQAEGIPFDERLAVPGSFQKESGAEAARALLRAGAPFDAIVCVNDLMALAAMDVLQAEGLRVPGDVAVVGFDGIEEGGYASTPLTTVVQPLRLLGSSAVDLLAGQLDGGEAHDVVLPCEPALRQSCGCPPRRGFRAELAALPASATAGEREAIDEMVACVSRGDGDGFAARLNRALAETVLHGGAPELWSRHLAAVRARSDGAGPEHAALFEFARVLVGDAEARLQAARRIAAENRLATLRAIAASLGGTFEMPVMLGRLQKGLALLGIGGGYIVLFDDPSGDAEWSRLVMQPDGPAPKSPPASGTRFPTRELLPAGIDASWRTRTWVLEPLVFQSAPLGYLLLPGGAEEPAVYGTLRAQVASALKGALLLEQVLSHERRLESEVRRRTAELTSANEELTREVERRRRLESEVSEISSRTMQRIGQDLHDDLCQHLAGIAMLASALRGALAGTDPAAADSAENIQRLLADSINRARQIARGLHPAGLEENGLAGAVEELVEAARRTNTATIEFRAAPEFRLPDIDLALQVYRIIQEALTNAIRHSGSDRIEVKLYREKRPEGGVRDTQDTRDRQGARGRQGAGRRHVLVAEVTDFGAGLPERIDGNGMGLRIMRYRAQSAGAELRIERLSPGTRVSCRIDAAREDD